MGFLPVRIWNRNSGPVLRMKPSQVKQFRRGTESVGINFIAGPKNKIGSAQNRTGAVGKPNSCRLEEPFPSLASRMGGSECGD